MAKNDNIAEATKNKHQNLTIEEQAEKLAAMILRVYKSKQNRLSSDGDKKMEGVGDGR